MLTKAERNNPRDMAILTLVRAYKQHPSVQRAISNQQKTHIDNKRQTSDIVGDYMAYAANYELLTAEDEVELFGYINNGVELFESLESLQNVTPEQQEIFVRAVAAQQVVFHTNLKLCINMAGKYAPLMRDRIPKMDLIQEANLGLGKAITRFDISMGYRFTTYASQWIRSSLGRHAAEHSRIIKIPVNRHDKYLTARRKVSDLQNELGRNLTPAEVEKASKMGLRQYQELEKDAALHIPSLNQPIRWHSEGHGEPSIELGTMVADTSPGVENEIDRLLNRDALMSILDGAQLSDKEMIILGLRFGLESDVVGSPTVTVNGTEVTYDQLAQAMETTDGLTLEAIAQIFGLTRERVRQLESKALKTLRSRTSQEEVA